MGIVSRSYDLIVDRFAPYYRRMIWDGIDLTGAVFKMQVRATPDTAGTPLLDLGNVTVAETLGIMIEEVGMGVDGVTPYTITSTFIPKTDLEALPAAPVIGSDAVMYYDFHYTPAGRIEQIAIAGQFIVRAGVTQ